MIESAAHGIVTCMNETTTLAKPTFDGTRVQPSESFALNVEPETKELYQYQLAAIETIIEHRRVILGMQPGMGKTAIMQAVAADAAARGEKSLVIVPPTLRLMWQREFETDYPELAVASVTVGAAGEFPEADVILMSDSLIGKRFDDIVEWMPNAVFVDEAHRMKSPDAKRTKALIAACDRMEDAIVVVATGTLANNHAGDVYSPLRATGSDNAKAVSYGDKWHNFLDVWCITEMAWKKRVVVGCEDPEGLRDKLVTTCMINIPRDEVLDLPARTFNQVDVMLHADDWAKYAVVQKHFLSWIEENFGEDAMFRAAKAEAITKLMRLWEIDGKVKVKATADYVENLTEQGEQVVLMAWHSSVMDGLRDELERRNLRVGMVRGGMHANSKDLAVRAFQSGALDVIIGQVAAAGVGLTLTRSCHIVFAQLPWNPAVFAQATDRIYRIGQERACTVHLLTFDEGVSQRLWNVLQFKAEIVDAINNGKPTIIDQTSVVNSVLNDYGWD
ncbi:MAG: DEAD/DEAH box helicase [Desulfurellales bacterium]|nr:MAG: DEAD/DEAH box helicase [Desulfurellales bacterium]